ncbi:helix-turn-helix transcriptional regulator [Sphingomonas sp. HT-1]|uniref:helix-turn-helix transcriptional regulator n=1 Tax=unclassified Sphingomonas TaxID=196159 RepID=UPI0007365595|nr:helix-turn-helix transcriptional regulator [Sphingomonas sp. WG]KTF70154.1 hypothetical protein ATB93_06025 [Sphingomonas sp. WG]
MERDFATRILPALYGCCEHPEGWRSVLDEICKGAGARSAAVQIYSRRGNCLIHGWQERDSYSHEHAALHDRWINNPDNPRLTIDPSRLPSTAMSVLTDRQRFAQGSPQLAETRRRLAQIGLRGGAGLLLEFAPHRYLSLILHRRIEDADALETCDVQLLEALGPHLHMMARLSMTVQAAQAAEAALACVLDRLRAAILLCTADGDVRWHNRAAVRMTGQGAPLRIVEGRLRALSPEGRAGLRRLLATAQGAEIASATIGCDAGGQVQAVALPIDALAASTPSGMSGSGSEVALLLVDPARPPIFSTTAVMSLFGLTPAEAQLAIALSHGLSLTEYAARRGVSVGTVRIQSKRILDKTGSRRQSDLVGKLYASALGPLQGQIH